MTAPLFLVRAPVDMTRLSAFAARAGVLDDDLGYATHLALRRRFGAAGPQPFRLMPEQGLILGYAADPARLDLPAPLPGPLDDWSGPGAIFGPFESRAMPATWPTGTRLRFDLRIRPVRRHGAASRARRAAAGARGGGERDAFLCAIEASEAHEPSREAVYRSWLEERLAPAADLEEAAMTGFARARVLRSVPERPGRGRRGAGIEGPDAQFEGQLRVRDGARFAALLARGLGRHAAFGHGMLLLRPGGG